MQLASEAVEQGAVHRREQPQQLLLQDARVAAVIERLAREREEHEEGVREADKHKGVQAAETRDVDEHASDGDEERAEGAEERGVFEAAHGKGELKQAGQRLGDGVGTRLEGAGVGRLLRQEVERREGEDGEQVAGVEHVPRRPKVGGEPVPSHPRRLHRKEERPAAEQREGRDDEDGGARPDGRVCAARAQVERVCKGGSDEEEVLRGPPPEDARAKVAPLPSDERAEEGRGEELLALVLDDELVDGEGRPAVERRESEGRRGPVERQDDAVERVPEEVVSPPAVLEARLCVEEPRRQRGQRLDAHRERRAVRAVLAVAVDAELEQQLRRLQVARRLHQRVQRVGAVAVRGEEDGRAHALPHEGEDVCVAVEGGGVRVREARRRLQQPLHLLLEVESEAVQQREGLDVALEAGVRAGARPVLPRVVCVGGAAREGLLDEGEPLRLRHAGQQPHQVALVGPHQQRERRAAAPLELHHAGAVRSVRRGREDEVPGLSRRDAAPDRSDVSIDEGGEQLRLCVGRFVAQVVGREGAADVLCAEAAEEQVLHGVHGLSVLEAPGERGRQLRDLHLELAHLGCRRRPHVADCWRLGNCRLGGCRLGGWRLRRPMLVLIAAAA
mmetsp:Transcript_43579/g.141401  ORF Transcript_43579/g.141401 Transcript_43579/m.141401 type:complete len:617 (+) Transcript_43579:398-2248(+)